jgi:hypothetical protein
VPQTRSVVSPIVSSCESIAMEEPNGATTVTTTTTTLDLRGGWILPCAVRDLVCATIVQAQTDDEIIHVVLNTRANADGIIPHTRAGATVSHPFRHNRIRMHGPNPRITICHGAIGRHQARGSRGCACDTAYASCADPCHAGHHGGTGCVRDECIKSGSVEQPCDTREPDRPDATGASSTW